MFDRIAYTELTAFITNQLPSGTSFALNEHDSAEQIFIPSQLARVQNICRATGSWSGPSQTSARVARSGSRCLSPPIVNALSSAAAPPTPAVTQIVLLLPLPLLSTGMRQPRLRSRS
jgi:hypothetical protein